MSDSIQVKDLIWKSDQHILLQQKLRILVGDKQMNPNYHETWSILQKLLVSTINKQELVAEIKEIFLQLENNIPTDYELGSIYHIGAISKL